MVLRGDRFIGWFKKPSLKTCKLSFIPRQHLFYLLSYFLQYTRLVLTREFGLWIGDRLVHAFAYCPFSVICLFKTIMYKVAYGFAKVSTSKLRVWKHKRNLYSKPSKAVSDVVSYVFCSCFNSLFSSRIYVAILCLQLKSYLLLI